MSLTIPEIVTRWESAERPLFRGSLIDADGCKCAQGDVLSCAGFTDKQLRGLTQDFADKEVAKLLCISVAHSILLRVVNDRQDGCPQDVLVRPEKVLGDQAERVLAFWRHLDRMTDADWKKVFAARDAAWAAARGAAGGDAAWAAAWAAARDAAGAAAWAAAGDAAWAAAGDAAGAAAGATNEIQGAAKMRERKQDFFFLKMFGFNSPEEIPA